jgi:hypothetical protein
MSMHTKQMPRGHFHGVTEIVRFNWPRYTAALGIIAVVWLTLRVGHFAGLLKDGGFVVISLAVWWSVASLIASYWVYDCSRLMDWDWVKGELPGPVNRWLNIHAGLDESTARLREFWPTATGETVDIFTPREMTEDSIRRARSEHVDACRRVDYRALPFARGKFDAIFLFFTAHELRRSEARRSFLAEVHRVLEINGRVILVEHLRDMQNFAAYGYGFLHFHSPRTWLADIAATGLKVEREFPFTPFVRIFILRRRS